MKISLIEIFKIFFTINSITFGGGYTIVPIVADEFSRKRDLISEDEMYDIVALAQSGPGAMAVSTSLLTGYKLRGAAGAITALIASVLPCLIILSFISYFYVQFKTNFVIRSVLDGIGGAICAILLLTVIDLAKKASKFYRYFSWTIIISVFVLNFFFKIDTATLIIGSAMFSIIIFYFRKGDVKWYLLNFTLPF